MYEAIGPSVNRIINCINLPRIAADKECTGEIPIVCAEKTVIASEIPRFAGVNEMISETPPIELRNNVFMKLICIPKTPKVNCVAYAAISNCISVNIAAIRKNLFLFI